MAENKNKDKELQKTDKDDSLKSINTSKPVSKNTKPSSEFKKSKETKSIDSKSVVSKDVDSKESKKNISQNNKDKSPKNSDGKETKNDSNNDEKNIHQKKSESSLKVEKNKISLKNGNSKDIKRAAPGDSNSDSQNKTSEQNEYIEKLVSINRVAKVVKGGRRFSFAALVVVGDGNGMVGHGKGKAKEVPEAIKKATDEAKAKMIRVPLRHGRTLHHDIRGRFDSGKVYLRSAPSGTGVIAGGPMRALFESLGIKDVVAKSTGSSNPHNMIKATFNAFKESESPKSIASKRTLKTGNITEKKNTKSKVKKNENKWIKNQPYIQKG